MNPLQFGLTFGVFLFLLGCCGISVLFAFKDRIATLDIKPLLWRRNRLWNEIPSGDTESGTVSTNQNYSTVNNNQASRLQPSGSFNFLTVFYFFNCIICICSVHKY